MAATFTRESATIQRVYVRRVLTGGETVYDPLPYNLVKYDDGQVYVEPVASPALSEMTARDAETTDVHQRQLIVDRPIYNGLFELH